MTTPDKSKNYSVIYYTLLSCEVAIIEGEDFPHKEAILSLVDKLKLENNPNMMQELPGILEQIRVLIKGEKGAGLKEKTYKTLEELQSTLESLKQKISEDPKIPRSTQMEYRLKNANGGYTAINLEKLLLKNSFHPQLAKFIKSDKRAYFRILKAFINYSHKSDSKDRLPSLLELTKKRKLLTALQSLADEREQIYKRMIELLQEKSKAQHYTQNKNALLAKYQKEDNALHNRLIAITKEQNELQKHEIFLVDNAFSELKESLQKVAKTAEKNVHDVQTRNSIRLQLETLTHSLWVASNLPYIIIDDRTKYGWKNPHGHVHALANNILSDLNNENTNLGKYFHDKKDMKDSIIEQLKNLNRLIENNSEDKLIEEKFDAVIQTISHAEENYPLTRGQKVGIGIAGFLGAAFLITGLTLAIASVVGIPVIAGLAATIALTNPGFMAGAGIASFLVGAGFINNVFNRFKRNAAKKAGLITIRETLTKARKNPVITEEGTQDAMTPTSEKGITEHLFVLRDKPVQSLNDLVKGTALKKWMDAKRDKVTEHSHVSLDVAPLLNKTIQDLIDTAKKMWDLRDEMDAKVTRETSRKKQNAIYAEFSPKLEAAETALQDAISDYQVAIRDVEFYANAYPVEGAPYPEIQRDLANIEKTMIAYVQADTQKAGYVENEGVLAGKEIALSSLYPKGGALDQFLSHYETLTYESNEPNRRDLVEMRQTLHQLMSEYLKAQQQRPEISLDLPLELQEKQKWIELHELDKRLHGLDIKAPEERENLINEKFTPEEMSQWEAMDVPDRKEFIKDIEQEITDYPIDQLWNQKRNDRLINDTKQDLSNYIDKLRDLANANPISGIPTRNVLADITNLQFAIQRDMPFGNQFEEDRKQSERFPEGLPESQSTSALLRNRKEQDSYRENQDAKGFNATQGATSNLRARKEREYQEFIEIKNKLSHLFQEYKQTLIAPPKTTQKREDLQKWIDLQALENKVLEGDSNAVVKKMKLRKDHFNPTELKKWDAMSTHSQEEYINNIRAQLEEFISDIKDTQREIQKSLQDVRKDLRQSIVAYVPKLQELKNSHPKEKEWISDTLEEIERLKGEQRHEFNSNNLSAFLRARNAALNTKGQNPDDISDTESASDGDSDRSSPC